jgi:hypothetical protein
MLLLVFLEKGMIGASMKHGQKEAMKRNFSTYIDAPSVEEG